MVADCSIAPAIFSPKERRTPTSSWALGEHTIQEFCTALSVVCDSEIQDMLVWEDYGQYSAFRTESTLTTSFAPKWERPRNSDVFVGKRQVARALDLLKQSKGRKNLPVAIDQWRKSKRYMARNVEQLICLRTALEALLLGGGSRSELKYRLSLHGAFLLGADGADRKEIFDELGKFYNLASAAVHDGEVKHTEQNRLTLAFAQQFCRRAILKRAEGSQRSIGIHLFWVRTNEKHDAQRLGRIFMFGASLNPDVLHLWDWRLILLPSLRIFVLPAQAIIGISRGFPGFRFLRHCQTN